MLLPILLDMSIVTITNIFQVITFFTNVTIVYSIAQMSKKYPEAWAKNKFRLSKSALYAFCTVSIMIYTIIFVKGIVSIKPVYAVAAVVVMVCFILLGVYLSKRGGIHVETSVWASSENEEPEGGNQ